MAIAPYDLDQRSAERDRRLVEAHQAGDPDAFAAIVADHYPALLAQAQRRLVSRVDAEDVVQEVFERALRAIDRFGGEYRLGAWLSLITTNVCATYGARRTSQRQLPERLVGDQMVTPDLSDSVSDPAVLATVLSAIDRLPRSQRSSFVLHAIDGLPYPDVADQLGITEANARARVHRARVTLQRRLHGVRSLLGAVVGAPLALPRALQRLAGRVPVGELHDASSGSAVPAASGVGPAPPTAGQSLVKLQHSVSQLAVQVATSPQAQSAVAGVQNPRGSLLAVVAGVAAVATATLSPAATVTATGGTPPATRLTQATASPTPDLLASDPVAERSTVKPSSAPPATPASAAPLLALQTPSAHASSPAAATSTTSGSSPAAATSTTSGSSPKAGVPSWVVLAGVTPPSTKASTGASTPADGTTGTTGTGSPPSTSTAASPTAAPCPWLAAFPGATPGPILSTPPMSGTVADLLGTDPVTLADVSTTPVFHTSATLTNPRSEAAGTPVSVLSGACVAPDSGVLVVNLTAADGTEVQLRGALASTTGTSGDRGYLFRGTTVVLNGQAPASSSTSPASLPWGISADFAAQLLLRKADNTAQLAVAFIEPPGSGGDVTTGTSTTTAPTSSSSTFSPLSSTAAPASGGSDGSSQADPTTNQVDEAASEPRRPG